MDVILQGLLEVPGVRAGMVFDATGRLVGHRADAVYDSTLCEASGGSVIKAIDCVALQQPDWEAISAQYANGRLLVKNLGDGPAGAYYLAVVADQSLNASFATVALRVASNKLKKLLAGGAPAAGTSRAPGGSLHAAPASPAGQSAPAAASSASSGSSRALAGSGIAWSSGASSVTASGLAVADAAASAFLTRCTRELARFVGPMSKVYVSEAVRRVAPDSPFSLAQGAKLVEDLAAMVKVKDRARFLEALGKEGV